MPLADCRQSESPFGPLLLEAAREFEVETRALGVRVLLHLPRVATVEGMVTLEQVEAELRRSAVQLTSDQRRAAAVAPRRKRTLDELVFDQVKYEAAQPVFSYLHYLRNNREGAVHYGLLDPDSRLPLALCSLSPLEWKLVGRGLERNFDIARPQMWDVSRVYSFDIAPPNSISYLLAKVRLRLRENPPEITAALGGDVAPELSRAELLVTAVDPNLGFTGSSYRAANWQHWMSVQARPYVYHERRYTSPRQLREQFHTANIHALREGNPRAFQMSRAPLLDSMIYCCRVYGTTSVIQPEERARLRR
jgi:hypothetical protein